MGNKQLGKVKNFDGYTGIIVTQNDIYTFNTNDALTPVKDSDIVEFYADTVIFDKETTKVTRKIETYNPEDIKKLFK